MIAKNEEKNLEKFLSKLKNYVNEIIVVDTGSKDNTKEIARSFGAKIISHKWGNNFSQARNISIKQPTYSFNMIFRASDGGFLHPPVELPASVKIFLHNIGTLADSFNITGKGLVEFYHEVDLAAGESYNTMATIEPGTLLVGNYNATFTACSSSKCMERVLLVKVTESGEIAVDSYLENDTLVVFVNNSKNTEKNLQINVGDEIDIIRIEPFKKRYLRYNINEGEFELSVLSGDLTIYDEIHTYSKPVEEPEEPSEDDVPSVPDITESPEEEIPDEPDEGNSTIIIFIILAITVVIVMALLLFNRNSDKKIGDFW